MFWDARATPSLQKISTLVLYSLSPTEPTCTSLFLSRIFSSHTMSAGQMRLPWVKQVAIITLNTISSLPMSNGGGAWRFFDFFTRVVLQSLISFS
jgi:hypothetical protein